jgi:serine/threonine-protein kinase
MSEKIGRYEILSELSHSPIGFVYKATDAENSQTVALKVLTLASMGEHVAEMVQRLVQEAQGTGTLSSHNIAQLIGVDEIEGKFCAALEYVQGNSVATMLARNEGFSIWDIKDIARQSAQALDHASSRKVFHYSLEPDKIMSGWDGTVKILGFGISSMSIPSSQLHGQVPRIMHYMSPEQWMGQPVDARSNLFSLAAIFYEMMTEQKAFDGENEDAVKQQILEGTPAPPHQINNKITLEVSNVIMKALSKAPAERFATGQELVAALEGHKEPTTVKKAAPSAKGSNAPNKAAAAPKPATPAAKSTSAEPAKPVDAAPAQPGSTAPAPPKQAAAAAVAAGWGGVGTGSPTTEARSELKVESAAAAESPVAEAAVAPAIELSAAVEEPPAESPSFVVDPAMDEKRAKPATKSFSELDELPPLKEVYVAPPPPVEQAPAAQPEPVGFGTASAREEKPKIQPRVVAQKAVQEIKQTPPKLFGYAIAGAVVLILLVVGGIAYHIHSENGSDDGPPPIAQQTQPQPAPAPAPAPVQAAPEPAANEPDVITIQPKAAPRKPKPAAPVIVPGEVNISSNPEGAQIQFDGQSDPSWVTPVDLTQLTPGKHTVTVSKAGYASQTRTVDIASNGKAAVAMQLSLLAASLSVTSSPAGAKIFVDGKDAGQATPAQISVEKPGNHTILVRKDGYLDETTSLNLQAGQAYKYSPSLRQLGATDDIKIKKFLGGGAPEGTCLISVKTQPKGAQIAINRRVLDKPAPVEFYLNPGTYVVDITAAGYKSVQKVINVEKGGKMAIDENLSRE